MKLSGSIGCKGGDLGCCDWPEKHLVKTVEILLPVNFSLNSIHWLQRRSWKCISQSEAKAAILVFRSALKHKLGRGRWYLASCEVSLNSVAEKKLKMPQPIRDQGGHICFLISPKTTKLVEDIEILQLRWIPFSGCNKRSRKCLGQLDAKAAILVFRSAQKYKFGKGRWDFASC